MKPCTEIKSAKRWSTSLQISLSANYLATEGQVEEEIMLCDVFALFLRITILGTSAKWLSVLQERDVRPSESMMIVDLCTSLYKNVMYLGFLWHLFGAGVKHCQMKLNRCNFS